VNAVCSFCKLFMYHLQREGLSTFNKIYEFECNIFNQRCQMIMTSVSGHLLQLEFVGSYSNWQACSPMSLFDAPVRKYCPQDYQQIKVFVVYTCFFQLFIYYYHHHHHHTEIIT
jgi:hypothetical protein